MVLRSLSRSELTSPGHDSFSSPAGVRQVPTWHWLVRAGGALRRRRLRSTAIQDSGSGGYELLRAAVTDREGAASRERVHDGREALSEEAR